MIESVLSLAAGGLTGLLGTAVSFGTRHLAKRQAHRHELELRQLDLQLAEAEAQGAARQVALETDARKHEAASTALQASYSEAANRWSVVGDSGWMIRVDVVRGLTRPLLTWAGAVGLAWVWGSLPADSAESARVVDAVIYLASTCVLWWFGARAIDKVAA